MVSKTVKRIFSRKRGSKDSMSVATAPAALTNEKEMLTIPEKSVLSSPIEESREESPGQINAITHTTETGPEETGDSNKEEKEGMDEDAVFYKRVNTLHADITIPMSAKSGEELFIVHDEEQKKIHIPSGMKGGEEYTVRLVSQKDKEVVETGPFCGCL